RVAGAAGTLGVLRAIRAGIGAAGAGVVLRAVRIGETALERRVRAAELLERSDVADEVVRARRPRIRHARGSRVALIGCRRLSRNVARAARTLRRGAARRAVVGAAR